MAYLLANCVEPPWVEGGGQNFRRIGTSHRNRCRSRKIFSGTEILRHPINSNERQRSRAFRLPPLESNCAIPGVPVGTHFSEFSIFVMGRLDPQGWPMAARLIPAGAFPAHVRTQSPRQSRRARGNDLALQRGERLIYR